MEITAEAAIVPQPDQQSQQNDLNSAQTFSRDLERSRALLIQNPASRPILYRILEACLPTRYQLYELEDYIQQLPEYTGVTQPPYFLIQWLLDVSALEMFELDGQGNDITGEQKQGLSEDEIDDLVADFAFKTSEVGSTILEEFLPSGRLGELLATVPERYDTYLELLEFLTEKRSYAEVDELLRGRAILETGSSPSDRPMQPSVFIDKLAATGSIVYTQGWQLTPDGKEYLERIREARS